MPALSRRLVSLSVFFALTFSVGCGGSGSGSSSTTSPTVTVTPSSAESIDQNQVVHLTAAVANDINAAGVTWSVSGGGTLSANTITSVTYTAPSTVTTATTVTVTATSNAKTSATASESINVNPAPTISTSAVTLPAATIGTAYSTSISTTLNPHGGSGTLTWTLATGTLPAGLTLSAAGTLSGTPTAAGTAVITVTATDSSAAGGVAVTSGNITIVVSPPLPTITTTTLPSATVGIAYSQQLACSNCNSNSGATWAATPSTGPGSLANLGLSLNTSTGVISGTPTAAGNVSITVTISYSSQISAGVVLALVVNAPASPTVTTSSLPNATVGIGYNQQLACSNCNSNSGATWAATPSTGPGSLANLGLSLNTSTGVISGTPTGTGNVSIAITVSYNSLTSTSVNLSFVVSNPSSLSINSLNGSSLTGEVNLPFGAVFTASGGAPPYTWSISSGTPPTGINSSLSTSTIFDPNGAGVLSGTPTATATNTAITVKVTDHSSNTATANYTITVNAATNRTGNNAALNGQYAFLVTGFDSSGSPVARIGSFTANGAGAITGGQYDVNGTASNFTSLVSAAITGGSYNVGSNDSGVLTTTTASSGSVTYVISIDKIVSGVAASGYMIRWDSSGNTVTGRFQQQTSADFNTASVNGSYAFGLSGFKGGSSATSLSRAGAIGVLSFDGAGNINPSGSEFLSSDGGTTPLSPTTGTYTINSGSGSANGRGTFTFSFSGGGGTNTADVVFYVIDNTKVFLLASDPGNTNDLLSGQGQLQTGAPYSTSSLSGATIFHSSGLVGTSSPYSAVTQLGTATWTSGAVIFSLDVNSGGTADGLASSNTTGPWNPIVSSGTYTVASNGRVTLSGVGLGSTPSYFYLAGANTGFSMDFSSSVDTGAIEPQTSTTLNGSFSGGTVDPMGQNTAYSVYEVTPTLGTSPNGTFTAGVSDNNQFGYLVPDSSVAGATYTGSATGRTIISDGGGSSAPTVLYVVGSNKVYVTSLNSGTPVLLEFTHQ